MEAAEKARKLGYTNVRVYNAGFPEWAKAHPTLVAGGEAPAAGAKAPEIVGGKDKGSIAVASFDKVVKEAPDSVMLVDTRDAKEFAAGATEYAQMPKPPKPAHTYTDDEKAARKKVLSSAGYLFEHLADVPAFVIPCIEGRYDGEPLVIQATAFGSILPAVWSFMLAARSRGLGTSWTTVHLAREAQVAEILGISRSTAYELVAQDIIPSVALRGRRKLVPRWAIDELLHPRTSHPVTSSTTPEATVA